MIFCNTIEACRRVENALRRADRRGQAYRLWVYHSAVAFVTATLTPAAQKAIEAQFPLVERRRGRGEPEPQPQPEP